jgi:hypothetical protein
VSNLLFNYVELVRGGDSRFALDYMVERILEEDAIYAEPTQEVIEKVDDLANYKSPEDADEYIWEWLDGLAEEKGTWIYTIMFDHIWVSDGSSYDLHDHDFDEEDEEAIKFAGTPLEEKQTLSETHIKREFFEGLVDKFANEGYTYYPLDRFAVDFSRISIFLWLEQQAGDNAKAFTFVTTKKASGDVTGISIYSMPGERYYYFDNATDEDLDLIAGAGQLNESVKGWDKDVDFSNPEDLADALVRAEASFIDPGFFYEEIAIDVDRSDDDADYEDIYYEALAQALFDAYGDDKLYYTFYYDDPSENYIMLFSDGEYAYIEDSYNWTDDDYEMITGAGMLEESYGKHAGWGDGVKWGTELDYIQAADRLADIGAKYIDMPKWLKDLYHFDMDIDTDDEAYEILANKFTEEYGSKDVLYFSDVEADDGGPLFIFSDGTYWKAYNIDDEGVELVKGAGMLNENKTPLQHLKSLSTRSGYELADTLANIGAHYVELPDSDIAYLEDLDYEERDEELYKVLDKILSKSDHEIIFTYFPYDETFNIATATFNEVFYLQDFDDVFGQEAIDLVTGAGQLNEVTEVRGMMEYRGESGFAIEEAANRLVEIGAVFIHDLDFDPSEMNQRYSDTYLTDIADFMQQKYGDKTLYYALEEFYDGNNRTNAFVFSDGEYVDVTMWSDDEIELFKGAGELLQESLADKPTSYKIEVLANDVVDQDLQYLEMTKDNIDELRDIADKIRDEEIPIGDYDKYIIKLLKEARQKTGKEHFTVVPVSSQIQYAEDSVIDFQYYDEFLTRFLPNADKSDLELLRGAGQLNEVYKGPTWWNDIEWNKEFTAEDIANKFAEIGAEYVDAKDIDLPNRQKYIDNGDLEGWAEDAAYELKIHTYENPNLTFSIVRIEDAISLITSDVFTFDLWDFSDEEIKLIIGSGQLNENKQSWDDGIDIRYPEDLADRLAEIGAEYYEFSDEDWDEMYARGLEDDSLEVAMKYLQEKGKNLDQYPVLYSLFKDGDGVVYFIFSNYKAITIEDLTNDDIDMIIRAGQLNEYDTNWDQGIDFNTEISAEKVADRLVEIGAKYVEVTTDIEPEEEYHETFRDYLDEMAKLFSEKYGHEEELYYTYYIDDDAFIFSDGTYWYDEAGFLSDDVDLVIGAGQLNEQKSEYVDPLASMTDSSKGEQLADALANAGARYVEGEWLDEIEYKYENKKYQDRYKESSDEIIEELRNEFKKEDTIVFTYFQPERVFITYDGKYYETFYVSAFDDISGTADVRMIIDAGMLNEAIDLEDNKIGDMIDAYTYDIYSLIDPMGADQGNAQDLSSGYMYKYGDSQNPADYHMENSWNTDLPKPIAETFEGLIESSFMQERALDYSRDEFLGKHPEVEQEFYGMHDELDPDIFRDAGYDELADELENDIKEQEAAFLEDDYEIIFGSAINTNFDRDPESIYVHVYCQIYEFSDGIILKEVDLGVAYNNIKTVEDFRNAMKDFMTEKISAFLNGEPPAEIRSDEEVGESKKPLNENANFENLLDNITKFPLHYVDLEDSLEKDMISYIQTSGMLNRRDDYEIDEYIWKTVSEYLEKLDRKAGFIDSEGRPETDEGFFTILGSDFWGELGYFVNDDQWNVYTSMGFDDTYTLTKDEVQDVIEAGQIYDNPLKEQEEEETEYNPTFEQIDEMIENATEELIYQVGRSFDSYGDPGIERLESGEGVIRFADGGFRSSDMQNINVIYGNMGMPTKEADEKIEKLYDELQAENHEFAVKKLKDTSPEVYAEFAGDPEMLTYQELDDAGDAYAGIDSERSEMYYKAAQELAEIADESFYDDDDAIIYFEVEINYQRSDYPDGDNLEPELTFRGEVGTNYTVLAAKEVIKTFTSEEELEKALAEGAKEIEDWFDGSEYDKGVSEISEEVSFEDSKKVYDDLVQHARNTIDLANPQEIEDIDKESYLSYYMGENNYIDMMEYMNGNFELPPDFEKSVIFDIDDRIYETSEVTVMNDIEDYLSREILDEFSGIQDELVELYKSGELEDIDEDLYSEIKYQIDEKYGEYLDDTGVMRSFELFVDSVEEKIRLIAKINLDPEYDNIEEKKDVELNFSDVDKAKEIIQNMANWLNGDAYL